jgi:hypothetical protein
MRDSTASGLAAGGLILAISTPAWACMPMSGSGMVLLAALGALFAGVPYMLLTAPFLIALRKGLFDSLRGLIAGLVKAYVVGVVGLMAGGAVSLAIQALVREVAHRRVSEQVLAVIMMTTPLLFEAAWISRRWAQRAALRAE